MKNGRGERGKKININNDKENGMIKMSDAGVRSERLEAQLSLKEGRGREEKN